MNRSIAVAALAMSVFVPAVVSAGAHDGSLWMRFQDGDATPIPWYVYSGKAATFDVRYNFDQPHTLAGFVGHTFGGDALSVMPYVGFLAGGTHGASAQVNLFAARGKMNFFLLNQYAWMGGETRDFAYHWGDFLYAATGRLSAGVDEELYKEPTQDYFFDAGPTVKIRSAKGLYFKVWFSVDPGHNWNRKLYLTIGYAP